MESLKGKLTEEETRELLKNISTGTVFYKDTIRIWEEKGYIKQNPVKKAKEEFHDSFEDYMDGHPKKAIAYISELEKQNEALKKQLGELK